MSSINVGEVIEHSREICLSHVSMIGRPEWPFLLGILIRQVLVMRKYENTMKLYFVKKQMYYDQ